MPQITEITDDISQQKKLLIITATNSNSCTIDYITSLLSLQRELSDLKLQNEVMLVSNENNLGWCKNYAVAKFLSDKSFTHALFLNSNIAFKSGSVTKLFESGKDIIGCACPQNAINWNNVVSFTNVNSIVKLNEKVVKLRDFQPGTQEMKNFAKSLEDESKELVENIKANVLSYAVDVKQNSSAVDGVITTDYLSSDLLLITRSVLEKIADDNPNLRFEDTSGILDTNERGNLYSLFEPSNIDGKYYNDDQTFCKKCVASGFSIHVALQEPVTRNVQQRLYGNIASLLTVTNK